MLSWNLWALVTRPSITSKHATTTAWSARRAPVSEPSQAAKLARIRRPICPLFSAWNCVAAMLRRPTTEEKVMPYSVAATRSDSSSGTAWYELTK